jgi:hypothetical protein
MLKIQQYMESKFLQENGFLDDNTGKISLADKLEGETKLVINQDQRKPLTVRQVVQFLVTLDMDEEILILHPGDTSIAAPLAEILIPKGRTTPEFISLYARDEMNKKQV